jgi:hypothetical protein
VFTEKDLSWKSDREHHNNHDSKRQCNQPYAAAPSNKGTVAVHATRAEKPATQNEENEQQHHDMCHSYRGGPGECEHVIKKEKYEHNGGEKKTGLPRHLVAKKTCGELHEPRIGDQTHRYENQPWDDHKQGNSNETEMSCRERERAPLGSEMLKSCNAG